MNGYIRFLLWSTISVADLEGGPGGPPPPPPFQTPAYIVYYLEGKWMNNLTTYLLKLIKKVQFSQNFLLASLAQVVKVCRQSRKTFLFLFCFLLRFPTLVGNLSVFVLSFLIKVSDVSRKPFCFRFVFSYYSLFFILYFSSLFSTSLSIHNFVNFQPIDFKFSTSV